MFASVYLVKFVIVIVCIFFAIGLAFSYLKISGILISIRRSYIQLSSAVTEEDENCDVLVSWMYQVSLPRVE